MTQSANPTFEQWCLVEIFGHERIAGLVSEASIGGCNFVRVDVPAVDGQAAFTRFYGQGAIYSITPVSEAIARRAALSMRVKPVSVYLLPSPNAEEEAWRQRELLRKAEAAAEQDELGQRLADDLSDEPGIDDDDRDDDDLTYRGDDDPDDDYDGPGF